MRRARDRRHRTGHAPARAAAPPAGRSIPGRDAAVLLSWALDRAGAKVHVGALDPRRRRARAPFSCLACGEPLVARLGAVRARHFAHRPGSDCPLTRPESALHLDAKERLLFLCGEAFAGRLRVELGARCPRCRRETPLDLAALGDGAAPESQAGAVRADVLVTRRGLPSLALEVKVTHGMDPGKEATLAALDLPALEIDAREPWEEERAGGVALRVARTLGLPPCSGCQATDRAEQGRQEGGEAAAIAELESYRARGLLGPRPGPALDAVPAFSAAARGQLREAFRCPECGRSALSWGERIARHTCGGGPPRPVAWLGYDGVLIELGWWRRPR